MLTRVKLDPDKLYPIKLHPDKLYPYKLYPDKLYLDKSEVVPVLYEGGAVNRTPVRELTVPSNY